MLINDNNQTKLGQGEGGHAHRTNFFDPKSKQPEAQTPDNTLGKVTNRTTPKVSEVLGQLGESHPLSKIATTFFKLGHNTLEITKKILENNNDNSALSATATRLKSTGAEFKKEIAQLNWANQEVSNQVELNNQ